MNTNVLLFMQTNPFWSVSLLSENDKALARKQKVPSLKDLLKISKEHNISVIFDLKNEDNNNCISILNTIQESGISQNLVS